MKPKCPLCDAPEASLLHRKDDFTVFRCRACSLAFAWPQVSEETSRKIYGDSYYESWGIEEDPTVREMKKLTFGLRLRALEKIIPPGRILDVGCATGFFLEAAAERGWEAHGVEINPFAVEQARKQFGNRVIESTVEDAAFGQSSFDAIAMSDVLEHVPDPLATLSRANDLLRPGGLLAITTPNIASITARLLGRRWPHLKTEHQFYFSPRSLSPLLTRAGFSVISQRSAVKALSLNYIYAQRTVSRVPLLTPLASLLHGLLPDSIRRKPLYFLAGEMFVVAQKSRDADSAPKRPRAEH